MHQAVVIGAGPAGLATSRELTRRRIDHVVLERGDHVGHTWANLYDSLVLHTGKHMSALPGMPFPRSTPVFPTRVQFLDYLRRYAETFAVPLETGANVIAVGREAGGWRSETSAGLSVRSRTVVMATGIVANPHAPAIEGRELFEGHVLHSVDYRRPADVRGRRVLVIGVGNSAGEIAVELARANFIVTVAARSGRRIVPRDVLGLPIQYVAAPLTALPRPWQLRALAVTAKISGLVRGASPIPPPAITACPGVPLIGFHLNDALRAGTIHLRGPVVRLTRRGASFADGVEEPFDALLLATGYRPALAPLGNAIGLDVCGFARRQGRVRSADDPHLLFVGHRYDLRGALWNIGADAQLAARTIAATR